MPPTPSLFPYSGGAFLTHGGASAELPTDWQTSRCIVDSNKTLLLLAARKGSHVKKSGTPRSTLLCCPYVSQKSEPHHSSKPPGMSFRETRLCKSNGLRLGSCVSCLMPPTGCMIYEQMLVHVHPARVWQQLRHMFLQATDFSSSHATAKIQGYLLEAKNDRLLRQDCSSGKVNRGRGCHAMLTQ